MNGWLQVYWCSSLDGHPCAAVCHHLHTNEIGSLFVVESNNNNINYINDKAIDNFNDEQYTKKWRKSKKSIQKKVK